MSTSDMEREVDIWVDDDGFARRVVSTMSGQFRQRETLRFYDFGIPVPVVPPPADAVIGFAEVWARMMKDDEGGCIAADR